MNRYNSTFRVKPDAKPMRRTRFERGENTSQFRGRSKLKNGRRSKEWEKARAWLKKQFEKREITRCEFRFIAHDCWGENLGFAHCKKRRLLMEGEIWHVALACQTVHTILDEKMSHEAMHEAVHRAIENHGGVIAPV
jgi:hypothetical protein